MKRLFLFATSLLLLVSCGQKTNDAQNTQGDAVAESVVATEPAVPMVYSNAYDGYLNIRAQPTVKSAVLGQLRNGPKGAELLSVEGNWFKVRLDGVEGYVSSAYVQSTPTIAVSPYITSSWLQGVWVMPGAMVFYLIFDNGTFALVQQYGDVSYGRYKLEGSDIIFTHKHITPHGLELNYTWNETERLPINVVNQTIGSAERYSLISDREYQQSGEEEFGGETVFTHSSFKAYRNIIKRHVK